MSLGMLALLVVVTCSMHPGGSKSDLVSSLLPKREQCRENVAGLERLGVNITDHGDYSTAEYDELVWARFTYHDKVSQALLIYCAKMPDDGHYSVLIKGLHNGETMGSVVDGNYWK